MGKKICKKSFKFFFCPTNQAALPSGLSKKVFQLLVLIKKFPSRPIHTFEEKKSINSLLHNCVWKDFQELMINTDQMLYRLWGLMLFQIKVESSKGLLENLMMLVMRKLVHFWSFENPGPARSNWGQLLALITHFRGNLNNKLIYFIIWFQGCFSERLLSNTEAVGDAYVPHNRTFQSSTIHWVNPTFLVLYQHKTQ